MRNPLIGKTLAGKFTLESLLGTGAMGAVFRARHVALDGYVAVKVMHKEIAAEETFAQRFHREARAASRLDHANVIRVIDFGIEPDGSHYIVMEYVDGPDLFQVMKTDGPLPQERVVAIMTQVLSGVAAAHDTGVIHRDLKPENIMVCSRVDDDGATYDIVKVCDFGIAQLSDPNPSEPKSEGQRTLTSRGVLLGTPQYMSPEQARGEKMDARTDIYSLGVILYQMLADRLPFEGPTPIDVVLKHISEDAVPPSTHRSGVSAHLESVCMKALSKKREARFASAREMRAALRADGMTPLVSAAGVRSSRPARTLASASAPTNPSPTGLDLTHDHMDAAAFRPELKRSLVYASTALGLALLGVLLFVAFGGAGASSMIGPRSAESAPPMPVRIEPPAARTAATPSVSAEPTPVEEPRVAEHAQPHTTKATAGRRPSLAAESVQPKGAQGTGEHLVAASEPVATHEASSDLHDPPSETVAAAPHVTPPATDPKPVQGKPPSTTALRPESGRVRWRVAAVGGGATAGGVQRAVSRTGGGFTACYQKGLRARGKAVNAEGTLRLVCDEQGRIVSATLSGAGMPDVAECIRGLVTGITIPNADTGEAWATIAMTLSVAE